MSYSKSHVILIAFALDTPDSLENVTSKVSQLHDARHMRGSAVCLVDRRSAIYLRSYHPRDSGGLQS